MRVSPHLAVACATASAWFAGLSASAQDQARMFTWHDTGQAGLTETLMLVGHRDADAVVKAAQTKWAGVAPEDRVIVLAPWEMYAAVPFDASLPDIVKNGLDFSGMKSWWDSTLDALGDAGLAPSQVAMDYEHGLSYWHLNATGFDLSRRSHFESVWNDPTAYAALPDELKAYDASDIHWRDREPVLAWDRYATDVLTEALTDAFAEPLADVFPAASFGNYGDMLLSEDVYDPNGWRYLDHMTGDTAHPVLYEKDAETNLELLASVVAAFDDPTDVKPWVKAPRLIGWDTFEQTVEGAYDLGVRDFLLFNPGSDEHGTYAGDNAFAAQVIADLNRTRGATDVRLAFLPEPAALSLLLPGVAWLRRRR